MARTPPRFRNRKGGVSAKQTGDDMRLVCPNCSAQYEVDAAVIPDEGRDVLCSNCGHAWFQLSERQLASAAADEQAEAVDTTPAGPDPAEAAAAAGPAPDGAATEAMAAETAAEEIVAKRGDDTADATGTAPGGEVAPDAIMAQGAEAGSSHEVPEPDPFIREDAGAVDAGEAAEAVAAPSQRRSLDDDMLNVLREEAAREADARRAEGSSIETQPDLGLPEAPPPQPTIESIGAATIRAQRRHDDEAEGDEPGSVAPASRKTLLPDIEEINSTLTASSERRDLPPHPDEVERRRSRSGFRAGFSISFLIAVAFLLLYMSAPRLAQSLPALAPALDRYVASVDAGRIWLDARLRATEAGNAN